MSIIGFRTTSIIIDYSFLIIGVEETAILVDKLDNINWEITVSNTIFKMPHIQIG